MEVEVADGVIMEDMKEESDDGGVEVEEDDGGVEGQVGRVEGGESSEEEVWKCKVCPYTANNRGKRWGGGYYGDDFVLKMMPS